MNCFVLGSCFQEIWLELNRSGFSFQPLGLPLIPLAYWSSYRGLNFTEEDRRKLEIATYTFKEDFQIDLKLPVMGIRMGIPTTNANKSLRKEIQATFQPNILNLFGASAKQTKKLGP